MRNLYLLTFFIFLNLNCLFAQKVYQVKGWVMDNPTTPLPGASVTLLSAKDTLKTITDSLGKFNFKNLKLNQFSLQFRSIGYKTYNNSYTINSGSELVIAPIVMPSDSNMLSEVVIESKIIPVRTMKDTIEYDARAYKTRANDRVQDLIKQLPGVDIDAEGNVKTLGKTLTKMRVNGKDFFTGDVKEFIKRLPADMVSKVQLIDDYGDEDNFMGTKSKEPRKILNLVTKANKNNGRFGDAETRFGSNKQYGADVKSNFWNDVKQISVNGGYSTQDNGAGKSSAKRAAITYGNKIFKDVNAAIDYGYDSNKDDSESSSFVKTINESGELNTENETESHSSSNAHRVNARLFKMNKGTFFSANLNGTLPENNSTSLSKSMLTGVIHQDLNSNRNTKGNTPNLSFNGNFGKRGKNSALSVNLTASTNTTKSNENINDHIVYYQSSGIKTDRDSLLNRLVDTKNGNRSLNGGVTYSYNLPKLKKDTLAHRMLVFTYAASTNNSSNSLLTYVNTDLSKAPVLVDSLTTAYHTSFATHSLGLSYSYNSKRWNYSLGIVPKISILNGNYEGRSGKVNTRNISFGPLITVNYDYSREESLGLNISQNVTPPSFSQMQPVPDNTNLQNQIVGNPDLKPTENINAMLNYRKINTNGTVLQVGMNGMLIRNQVVGNTFFVKDTLNSMKQRTTYENASGSFNYNGNYSLSKPFADNKYSVELIGSAGYNQNIFYADNVKGLSKQLMLSQSLRMRMNQKWISMSINGNYSLNNSSYSIGAASQNNTKIWQLNADGKVIFDKGLNVGFEVFKTINTGYALASTNPLLINLNVEKFLFKKQQASVKLSAFDILNEGNNLMRIAQGNTLTDIRTNQVTRYFLMTLRINLEQFGINSI